MPAVLVSVVLHRKTQCDYVRMLQTRLRMLHVALPDLTGQTRALQLTRSKPLQLARLPRTMHAWVVGHRGCDRLAWQSCAQLVKGTQDALMLFNPTPARGARHG